MLIALLLALFADIHTFLARNTTIRRGLSSHILVDSLSGGAYAYETSLTLTRASIHTHSLSPFLFLSLCQRCSTMTVTLLAVLLSATLIVGTTAAGKPPNVIFILADGEFIRDRMTGHAAWRHMSRLCPTSVR